MAQPQTVLIDDKSALVGAIGAGLCATLGTIANIVTISVIIARKSIRKQSTSPTLFFLALYQLIFSIAMLPFQMIRFATKGGSVRPNRTHLLQRLAEPNRNVADRLIGSMMSGSVVH